MLFVLLCCIVQLFIIFLFLLFLSLGDEIKLLKTDHDDVIVADVGVTGNALQQRLVLVPDHPVRKSMSLSALKHLQLNVTYHVISCIYDECYTDAYITAVRQQKILSANKRTDVRRFSLYTSTKVYANKVE